MQGSASVGVFPEPVPDTNVAKYRESSDLAQQVIAPELHLLLGDKSDDRVFADFHLGQNNQMYNLHTGVYGLLDIQIQYLDMPHYLTDDVGSIAFSQNGGDFSLSSHLAPPTGGEPPGKNIGTWVNDVANPTAMSLLNGVANLNVRYTPDPRWTYTAQFNFQNPSGNDYSFGTRFRPQSGNLKRFAGNPIARRESIAVRYVERLSRLAFVAPTIVEAIRQGRQPTELSTETLLNRIDLPLMAGAVEGDRNRLEPRPGPFQKGDG